MGEAFFAAADGNADDALRLCNVTSDVAAFTAACWDGVREMERVSQPAATSTTCPYAMSIDYRLGAAIDTSSGPGMPAGSGSTELWSDPKMDVLAVVGILTGAAVAAICIARVARDQHPAAYARGALPGTDGDVELMTQARGSGGGQSPPVAGLFPRASATGQSRMGLLAESSRGDMMHDSDDGDDADDGDDDATAAAAALGDHHDGDGAGAGADAFAIGNSGSDSDEADDAVRVQLQQPSAYGTAVGAAAATAVQPQVPAATQSL